MKPLRFGSLVAAGALAVHELRYLVGSQGTTAEVAGHGYLPLAGLGAALLLAAAVAQLVALVTRARVTGRGEPAALGFGQAWLIASASIAGVFIAQELFEGLLASGRPGGLSTVFGSGGWVAIPAAAGIGALVALALVGARAVVAAAARAATRSVRRTGPRSSPRPLARGHRQVASVLAAHLAGRAPPLVL